MTMQVSASESNSASQEPAAGGPPADAGVVAQPDPPEAPKTPGEAAKEARLTAQLRAREERLKRKNDALFQEKQKFEAERKAHAETQAAASKKYDEELAQLRAELQEYKTGNPLLKPGVDVNTHLRELVAQGTPEAQIIALQKKIEKQEREFAERFEAITKASQEREEEEKKRRAEVQKDVEESKVRTFAIWATSPEMAKKYPHLNSEYSQAEIQNQAYHVQEWAKSQGTAYSGQEVIDYLEGLAKQTYKEREERRQLYLGAPPPADPAAAISGAKVAQPASGKKAPQVQRQRSEEEQIEADLAMLRQASEKDRIAQSGAGKKK